MTLPTLKDGRCTNCNSRDMVLAEDQTLYSPCEYNGQTWSRIYTDMQSSEAENAVRFYCAICLTNHAIPEELL